MRRQLQIAGWVVEYDRESTAAAYARIVVPGPEECVCWGCRNWVAGRDRIVPPSVRELLAQLGIPVNGEIEVAECSDYTAPHTYLGWYMLVGRVVAKPLGTTDQFWQGAWQQDGWQLLFSNGASYKVPEFIDQTVCELHFQTQTADFIPPPGEG